MNRICERALNYFQVFDEEGSVRLCGWARDGYIGKLTEHSVRELYNSPEAIRFRDRHIKDDYSLCKLDACNYLAMNEVDSNKVFIDNMPDLPDTLALGFERICNYSCISCPIHNIMLKNNERDLEENYRLIEERIREVLPFVKHVSSNGCGELFACKRTLKLLADWTPVAPADECMVSLETNGSLFNEKNWKQIENLGKYHLRVKISVMSFEEPIYRYLSGTMLPISNLIDNLYFVKKLRENGVINYLELATVVQEQNFRGMPEFVRRCLEDFGADYVRLRPYEWWGECSKDEAWFRNIRNPHHPLYKEYKKIMSHDIMSHPKVHDWSGGMDSHEVSLAPSVLQTLKLDIVTELTLHADEIIENLHKSMGDIKSVYIYGLSNAGKVLSKIIGDRGIRTVGFLDRGNGNFKWNGIDVVRLENEEVLDHKIPIVITTVEGVCETEKDLKNRHWNCVIALRDLILSDGIKERMKEV